MRIDCYNATECEVGKVECGDTFYFDGTLYIKVGVMDVDIIAAAPADRCYIVSLDRGQLRSVKSEAKVIMADTKVVANRVVRDYEF